VSPAGVTISMVMFKIAVAKVGVLVDDLGTKFHENVCAAVVFER